MICSEPGSGLGWEWALTPRQPARKQATKFAWSLTRGEPNWDQITRSKLADSYEGH